MPARIAPCGASSIGVQWRTNQSLMSRRLCHPDGKTMSAKTIGALTRQGAGLISPAMDRLLMTIAATVRRRRSTTARRRIRA
jgi:hypothetical protein